MAKYFNFFPKTVYSLSNTVIGLDSVTNIISRFRFENSLKDNFAVFYQYEVQEGDTPEIIAGKYYDNPERHWIVLMFNDIVDPQFDWPLDHRTFNEYVDVKYSTSEYADTANTGIPGLTWAKNNNNVKSYYRVITQQTSENNYTDKIEVDGVTYANDVYMQPGAATEILLDDGTSVTISYDKETKNYYDYENELNENKRKIKLLKKEFVPQVEKEFKRIIL